ncbi:aquaporin [Heterobasidion irregulare TC 32-1]|uniref:Aquaporin n=1 Tax=Heterobasidion irregulare (strain TC 32-1) TaxID=747525 RepID=W4K954_HETIT|nr:aquaporin [Heterobasidion irregulare TC 32-1]ETW81616.1 aquaporin [Heterobasidion irregulare TC 32-1]
MSLPVLKSFGRRRSSDAMSKEVKHLEDVDESPEDFEALHEYYTKYPNRWSRVREHLREPAAEMLGTMILILFGNGVDCQVVLSSNTAVSATPKGDYLSLNFGWACGAALGVWVSGGVTGGHINPVVTLALAVFRDFPWKKVPIYIFAQILGAWIGSLIVFANYFHAIYIFEGGRKALSVPGTASLFATYALDYMPAANSFFDQFVGTFALVLVVFAVSDKRNGPPPAGLVPLVIFIFILGVGTAFGMQTGYAINPARDLGPRIMTAMVGYGREVFNFRDQYWLWCPILGPIAGGLVGAFVYDALIFLGDESILNRPNAAARKHHAHALNAERQKPIAGAAVDEIV